MTTMSIASDPRTEKELIKELFKLSSNPYSDAKVKQAYTMIKKESFSVKRLKAERKLAEYFLEHDSGSSGELIDTIGPTFSTMSTLSLYKLGLVIREQDSNNLRCFIYHRIADKEKLSDYIDLMNRLIEKIERIKEVGYSES